MDRVREQLSGVDRDDAPFPLTDVQYAYWIGRQGLFDISNKPTHMYVELAGNLDPERLDAAWSTMSLSELCSCRWAGLDEIAIAVESLWHKVII
jgi:hypothetical protein